MPKKKVLGATAAPAQQTDTLTRIREEALARHERLPHLLQTAIDTPGFDPVSVALAEYTLAMANVYTPRKDLLSRCVVLLELAIQRASERSHIGKVLDFMDFMGGTFRYHDLQEVQLSKRKRAFLDRTCEHFRRKLLYAESIQEVLSLRTFLLAYIRDHLPMSENMLHARKICARIRTREDAAEVLRLYSQLACAREERGYRDSWAREHNDVFFETLSSLIVTKLAQ